MDAEILNELNILTTLGFELESLYIVEEGGLVFTREEVAEMTAAWEQSDRTVPMPLLVDAREWHDAWRARNPGS